MRLALTGCHKIEVRNPATAAITYRVYASEIRFIDLSRKRFANLIRIMRGMNTLPDKIPK